MSHPHMYMNPVRYADGIVRTDPDPYVMSYRGRYYCYSTDEHQVNVSTSRDLVTWDRLGAALRIPGRSHFWAPCVIYRNGSFHMYVSFRPTGSTDPHDELLHLATSASPEGPFTVVHRFFDTFSIDADVVPDANGGYVMFYSVNDDGPETERIGTVIVGDRLIAPDRLDGAPEPTVTPSIDQEIFEPNRFGDGRDWHTIEGATYIERGNRGYLTYSGNAYEREDYFIGQSSAPLTGAAPHELQWAKYPDADTFHPLVKRSDAVEGTGHNSITTAPNLVDNWIVYHGRSLSEPRQIGTEQRVMRIDPLWFGSRRIYADAPSCGLRPVPAVPHAEERDLVIDGEALLADELQSFVAEVWVGPEPFHAGFTMRTADGRALDVVIDHKSRTLRITSTAAESTDELAAADLGAISTIDWQRLRIERTPRRLTVIFAEVLRLHCDIDDGPMHVGLISRGAPHPFDGFSLTRHTELWAEDLAELPVILDVMGDFAVCANGISGDVAAGVAISGSRAERGVTLYEVGIEPGGRALVEPWIGESGDSLRIDIDERSITITRRESSGSLSERVEWEPHESTAVVRCEILDDEIILHIGTLARRYAISPSPSSQMVTLHGAHLLQYQETHHPHTSCKLIHQQRSTQ